MGKRGSVKSVVGELKERLHTIKQRAAILEQEKETFEAGESMKGRIDKKNQEILALENDIRLVSQAVDQSNLDLVQVQEEASKFKDLFEQAKEKLTRFQLEIGEASNFVDEVRCMNRY